MKKDYNRYCHSLLRIEEVPFLFVFVCRPSALSNIRSVDLCAILGNLLDNAIEAARQVPDPSGRTVALTIRRIHQMLVIKVENSFAAAPVQENGQLQTTKIGGGLHGWGLKSAQTAAEKYDGMVQAGVSGEIFRAVATLSYQGMEDIHE